MTLRSLGTRDRRALLLGVVVITSSILVTRGFPAWWEWRADQVASAAHAEERLAADRALAEALPHALGDLEDRLAKLRGLRPLLMIGRNPADAAAALSDHLREALEQAGFAVESLTVRPHDEAPGKPRRIVVDVEAAGDVTGLASLLERVEGPPYLLSVRRLAVVPDDVATPDEAAEALRVALTVEGLALTGFPQEGAP